MTNIKSILILVGLTIASPEDFKVENWGSYFQSADGYYPLSDMRPNSKKNQDLYLYPPVAKRGSFASEIQPKRNKSQDLYGTDMPYAERVTDGRFPSVIRFRFYDDERGEGGQCSGVLVTPRHILTAAHCAFVNKNDHEIHDSEWMERNGREAEDAINAWFSFEGTSVPGSREYETTQFWVHPDYNPESETPTTGGIDLMILVTADPIEDIEPIPIMPRRNDSHLLRGTWVRHVSFGPTEGGAAHEFKSTLMTRTTSTEREHPVVWTWGEASGGDSGSPVFQRQMSNNAMEDVLVGIVTNEGIRSYWINENIYNWIRSIVGKIDIGLLPDDYDGDGLANLDDKCLLRNYTEDSLMLFDDSVDRDLDGYGDNCDLCDGIRDGGQFDSDGDGVPNACDPCPIGARNLSYREVDLFDKNFWTPNPVQLKIRGVESDGRWFNEEYETIVTTWVRGRRRILRFYGLNPSFELAEGKYNASVRLRDGCFNSTRSRTIRFGVDDTPPTVSINRPINNSNISPRESFVVNVELIVGDNRSGIKSVELWLDATGPRDLEPGMLLYIFRGPWMTAPYANRAVCTLDSRILPYGEHRLYAVVTDNAGNKTTASSTIIVEDQ